MIYWTGINMLLHGQPQNHAHTPEIGLPHLPQKGFPQIKKLVLLKITVRVCVVGVEIISRLPV